MSGRFVVQRNHSVWRVIDRVTGYVLRDHIHNHEIARHRATELNAVDRRRAEARLEESETVDEGDLRVSKGIAIACLVGAACWMLIGYVIWCVCGVA